MADQHKRINVNKSRRNRRIVFNCLYFAIIPLLLYALLPPVWSLLYLLIILLPPTSFVYFIIMKIQLFEDVSISGQIRLSQEEIKGRQAELDEMYENE